jgi:hypothetical protein
VVKGERRDEVSLDRLYRVLGNGPLARAKVAALHVRRVIAIDLAGNLAPHSPVRLVNDDRAIFERVGAR